MKISIYLDVSQKPSEHVLANRCLNVFLMQLCSFLFVCFCSIAGSLLYSYVTFQPRQGDLSVPVTQPVGGKLEAPVI